MSASGPTRVRRVAGAALWLLGLSCAGCVHDGWDISGAGAGLRPAGLTSAGAGSRTPAARPVFLEPQLAGALEIGPVQTRRTERGLLEVMVPFHNLGRERLEILCKLVFKDAAGATLQGDQTGFQFESLAAGPTRKRFVSRQLAAASFELHVRRFRP